MPIGYPATESGVELRILKHLFTPEHVEIALTLGFYPNKIKQLHRKLKQYSLEELETKLDVILDEIKAYDISQLIEKAIK